MAELTLVVDTNVLSEPMRPKPNLRVMRRLRIHAHTIGVPAPVWHELLFGCQRLPRSRRRSAIEDYLERAVRACFPILPYDDTAAEWHARERARLSAAGLSPGFVDAQIAAIAAVRGLSVVTANVDHYRPFAGLEVVNWATRK